MRKGVYAAAFFIAAIICCNAQIPEFVAWEEQLGAPRSSFTFSESIKDTFEVSYKAGAYENLKIEEDYNVANLWDANHFASVGHFDPLILHLNKHYNAVSVVIKDFRTYEEHIELYYKGTRIFLFGEFHFHKMRSFVSKSGTMETIVLNIVCKSCSFDKVVFGSAGTSKFDDVTVGWIDQAADFEGLLPRDSEKTLRENFKSPLGFTIPDAWNKGEREQASAQLQKYQVFVSMEDPEVENTSVPLESTYNEPFLQPTDHFIYPNRTAGETPSMSGAMENQPLRIRLRTPCNFAGVKITNYGGEDIEFYYKNNLLFHFAPHQHHDVKERANRRERYPIFFNFISSGTEFDEIVIRSQDSWSDLSNLTIGKVSAERVTAMERDNAWAHSGYLIPSSQQRSTDKKQNSPAEVTVLLEKPKKENTSLRVMYEIVDRFEAETEAGTYDGLQLANHNDVGGLHRNGKYTKVVKDKPLTITLDRPHSYVGAWFFSLGEVGVVKFSFKGTEFFEFTAADMNRMMDDAKQKYETLATVDTATTTTLPATAATTSEASTTATITNRSGYFNFVCTGCLFDKVEFSYPSDNGYWGMDNFRTGALNLEAENPKFGPRTLTEPLQMPLRPIKI